MMQTRGDSQGPTSKGGGAWVRTTGSKQKEERRQRQVLARRGRGRGRGSRWRQQAGERARAQKKQEAKAVPRTGLCSWASIATFRANFRARLTAVSRCRAFGPFGLKRPLLTTKAGPPFKSLPYP
eukprot:6181531-Pleurochrysis_carterae.AAC.4